MTVKVNIAKLSNCIAGDIDFTIATKSIGKKQITQIVQKLFDRVNLQNSCNENK